MDQNDASRRPDDRVDHLPFLPVAPYSTAWFRLSDCSLISQATPFADHSVGRTENCWKNRKLLEDSVFRTVRSHLVLCCNMSPRCVRAMGVCRALALFGDAKQAMGEGKGGPVETGLTGPVATALLLLQFQRVEALTNFQQ